MAERAVVLDETLPQAHFALGFVYLYGQARHEDAIGKASSPRSMTSTRKTTIPSRPANNLVQAQSKCPALPIERAIDGISPCPNVLATRAVLALVH